MSKELLLYNSLKKKKEKFKEIKKGQVSMYSCGPTVYNYAHIGNLRTYIFNDFLKRSLKFIGYKVNHVMNITDVDDKTIKASKNEKKSLKEFTRKYEKIFFENLSELNIEKPESVPRATQYINKMVSLIEKLLKKGYAYKATDGIYFSINKFKDYGKLAHIKGKKKTKSRISSDEYDKENVQDFSLWKFYTEEDGDVFWKTKIGKGRPGWHIECSAMSMSLLKNPFDIHTGAIDLIFPHHTNEIAQSEASTGKKFVNYWLHGGFLTMKNDKMSKSSGNILILDDLKEMGFSPMDFRYLCLTTHYRKPLIFSKENLENAKNSYGRLKNIISDIRNDKKINKKYISEFESKIKDDLNIPEALQVLWKMVRDNKAEGEIETIKKMDSVLGLKLLEKIEIKIPKEIKDLAEKREKFRNKKDWKKADEIRNEIKRKGYIIEDKEKGYTLKNAKKEEL